MPKYRTARNQPTEYEVSKLLANTRHYPATGCRLWVGAVNTDGYPKLGRARFDSGRFDANVKGHRHLYEILHSITLEVDQVVRHTCDNPLCINPRHLLVGSSVDNVRDRKERGRCHQSVSDAEISKVKEALLLFPKFKDAANAVGISRKRLYYIRNKYEL